MGRSKPSNKIVNDVWYLAKEVLVCDWSLWFGCDWRALCCVNVMRHARWWIVTEVNGISSQLEDLYAVSSQRAVTGTLSSHPDCRDVHIDSLSITFHGAELLVDTRLELNNGRRYGLIGLNGCGESCVNVSLSCCIWFQQSPTVFIWEAFREERGIHI